MKTTQHGAGTGFGCNRRDRKPIGARVASVRGASVRWLMTAVAVGLVLSCKMSAAVVDAGTTLVVAAPTGRQAEALVRGAATAARASPVSPGSVLGAMRPGCLPPPRILTAEGVHLLTELGSASLGWALGRYEEVLVDGGSDDVGPASAHFLESIESDYFSELAPAKRIRLRPAGLARVEAVRTWWSVKLKQYKLLRPGVLSDHCLLSASDERQTLFSLVLSNDLVVQAIVDRASEPLVDERLDSEVDPDPIPANIYAELTKADREAFPITSVQVRVVKKSSGGQVTVSETQKMACRLPRPFGLDVTATILGDSDEAAVAIAFPFHGIVVVVTRDGRIPFAHERVCSQEKATVAILRSIDEREPHRLIVAQAEPNGTIGPMCREQAEVDAASDAWKLPPQDAGDLTPRNSLPE